MKSLKKGKRMINRKQKIQNGNNFSGEARDMIGKGQSGFLKF